jgi:hypothetical protein
MSIQKRGSRYVVRWREGGRQLQRTFIKHRDAAAFETDVKRWQQLGALAPGVIQSRMTLAEFAREEWWPRYAVPNLKPSTQRRYLNDQAPRAAGPGPRGMAAGVRTTSGQRADLSDP